MSLGDSKTLVAWQQPLLVNLTAASGLSWTRGDGGVAGSTVASYAAAIDGILAAFNPPNPPRVEVLMNWGANDVGAMPAEAAWKANYLTIIDAVSAKWPQAKMRLSKPWRRGYAAQCNTLAAWIDDIVAARPGVAFVADDERVWLENGDDGATRTTEGVHYSAAGMSEKSAQAQTVLGY